MYIDFSRFFPKAKIVVTYYEFLKAFSSTDNMLKFKSNLELALNQIKIYNIKKVKFIVKGKKFKAYKTFYWKGDKK